MRCKKCGYKSCACGLRFKTQDEVDAILAPAAAREPSADGGEAVPCAGGCGDVVRMFSPGIFKWTCDDCCKTRGAPAPLRDAREVALGIVGEEFQFPENHPGLIDGIARAISAARQPDVALRESKADNDRLTQAFMKRCKDNDALRELLEEGANQVEEDANFRPVSQKIAAWARRVREAGK